MSGYSNVVEASLLLFMLLNPFLLAVYLLDPFEKLSSREFGRVLVRAGVISTVVFILFAHVGSVVFTELLQARFASFQVFGGVVFLLIGIRFVFSGNAAIEGLRGESKHIAGAIAMPLMIGPGTIGASVVIGEKLGHALSAVSIISTIAVSVVVIYLLKRIHDFVRPRNEALVERYIDIVGRITALVIGTYAIEMIMGGLAEWFPALSG
jgi:multiple antibiotic resistance protein